MHYMSPTELRLNSLRDSVEVSGEQKIGAVRGRVVPVLQYLQTLWIIMAPTSLGVRGMGTEIGAGALSVGTRAAPVV
jgi:hypothetical protein